MELFNKPQGVSTRWISFENQTLERGQGGRRNAGAKGAPFDFIRRGESKVLMDVQASGTIRRIWMTIANRSPKMLRGLKLEMTWDGASQPAVSVPLGDFFGIGLGRTAVFQNALFSNPEGRSFCSFIPMPFRKGAKVTVTNESEEDLHYLFFDIDLTLEEHSADMLYFHAAWNRENPNELGKEFMILPEVKGAGRFLGCNIGIRVDTRYERSWWGEGEVKIRFGGEEYPTLCGTGTEDYIGTGWGQDKYIHQMQGCSISDKVNRECTFYRFHLVDPVWFDDSCSVGIQTIGCTNVESVAKFIADGAPAIPVTVDLGELGGLRRFFEADPTPQLSDFDGSKFCNFWRQDDWSATAYYYLQTPEGQHPLPPVADRVANLIESNPEPEA